MRTVVRWRPAADASPEEGSRRLRPPLVVWAVTALHVALLLAYTVLYPPYLGYDEPQHVDMVVALQAGDGWEAPGEREQSLGVSRTSDPLYGGGDVPALERPYGADDLPPRGERPSLDEAGGNAPATGLLPNQMVQHPPLWYATGAAVLAVLPGSERWPFDVTVAVLRLVSVLMVAPLPLLAWALARRLSTDDAVATTAAVLTLGIPGLTRVGASAGNDALVVLTFAAVLVAAGRVMTGDVRRRTALAAGGLVTLGLLAKGFGLVLPLVLLAAYGVAWLRRPSRGVLLSALIAMATSGIGALWWLRNLVRYDAVQPNGYGAEAAASLQGPRRAPGDTPPLGDFVGHFFEVTATRFWGGLGVPEPPTFSVLLASVLTVVAAVGVVAGLVVGLRRRRAGGGDRLPLVVVLLPLVLLLGPLVRSDLRTYLTYEGPASGAGIHGRYLYGAVAGLAVVAALGYRRLLGRAGELLPLVALLAVLAVQAFAFLLVLGDFWGRSREGLDALVALSPWPPPVTVLPLSAAAVLGVVCLVLAVRDARARVLA